MDWLRYKLLGIKYSINDFLDEKGSTKIIIGAVLTLTGILLLASIGGSAFDFISKAATGIAFLFGLLGGIGVAIVIAAAVYGVFSLVVSYPTPAGIVLLLAGIGLIIWGIFEKRRDRRYYSSPSVSSSGSSSSVMPKSSSGIRHDWSGYTQMTPIATFTLNSLDDPDSFSKMGDCKPGTELTARPCGENEYDIYAGNEKIFSNYFDEEQTLSMNYDSSRVMFVLKNMLFHNEEYLYWMTVGIFYAVKSS